MKETETVSRIGRGTMPVQAGERRIIGAGATGIRFAGGSGTDGAITWYADSALVGMAATFAPKVGDMITVGDTSNAPWTSAVTALHDGISESGVWLAQVDDGAGEVWYSFDLQDLERATVNDTHWFFSKATPLNAL